MATMRKFYPASPHQARYIDSLKAQERGGVVIGFLGALLVLADAVLSGTISQAPLVWGAVVGCLPLAAYLLVNPQSHRAYCATATVVAAIIVMQVPVGPFLWAGSFSQEVVVRRLFFIQALLASTFIAFRRYGTYFLALCGAVALALVPSLTHLAPEFARILYVPYIISTFILIAIFLAFDVMSRRSFLASLENQDLKDIEIAALTQISHVIKNKLNYVETFLPEWGEKIRAANIEDPDDDFGSMEFCVRDSLDAVLNINVLRNVKAGTYEPELAATQVDEWVAAYAANHDLAVAEKLPAVLVSFDVRIVGFVLEDGWSNAFTYGATEHFRPEMAARLLADGAIIEISITNRQKPGQRLPANTEHLFRRGARGARTAVLSSGFGLADARQAALAAGGTVSLEEHLRAPDGVWYTTFAVFLPLTRRGDCVIDVAPKKHKKLEAPSLRYKVAPEAPTEAFGDLRPFPQNLTVIAVDDERTQRRVLEKIFLGKLQASAKSVVVGADLEEVQSVVPLALSLEADIVILDQNLTHGGIVGTQLADELRADGFQGFIVLRTGSTGETLRRFQTHRSVDLAIGKEDKNVVVVEAIKRAWAVGEEPRKVHAIKEVYGVGGEQTLPARRMSAEKLEIVGAGVVESE